MELSHEIFMVCAYGIPLATVNFAEAIIKSIIYEKCYNKGVQIGFDKRSEMVLFCTGFLKVLCTSFGVC